MNNDYLDSLNKLARKRQLTLTKQQERAIFNVYNKAAEDYYAKFIDNMSRNNATNALHLEYAREVSAKLEKVITEYSIKGAENAMSLVTDIMDSCYDEYGLKNTPYANAVHSIANGIINDSARRIIQGEIYKDGNGLSRRLWMSMNRNLEKIDEVIAQCMAQQLSAVESSKILKSFLQPGQGTTWDRAKIKEKLGPGYAAWNKDISYEALRLARTTITHSATLAMKEAGRANPYLNSVRWHSVHAIGRTCEECKEKDGKVFTLAKLPFDHPNGLCWNEPILDKSLEQMAIDMRDWAQGGKNSRLDEWWKSNGRKNIPIPSKNPNLKANKPKEIRGLDWVDKNFTTIKDEVPPKIWKQLRESLNDCPDWLQDFYKSKQDSFKWGGKDKNGGAYYSPFYNHVVMNFDTDAKNSAGKFSTFFHEYGHFLDHGHSGIKGTKLVKPSENPKFIAALKDDYENLQVKAAKMCKDNGMSANYQNMKYYMQKLQREAGEDLSSGAQDIISGLSLNKYRYRWGHSTEYWKRSDVDKEVASEAWANMSSAYAIEDVGKSMQSLFPNAMKLFKDLVEELL